MKGKLLIARSRKDNKKEEVIGILTTSTSVSSNSSFITRVFDEDMKQGISTMIDMVREMYEDGRKSIILREQLNSMKEEKQFLVDKLQEMKRQLHIAIMNLKRMHELET